MTSDLLPQFETPAHNRRVLLSVRPVGIPDNRHFTIDQVALEPVAPGKFMVRNLYLSVDPAQRGWVNAAANYAVAVEIGSVMRSLAVGIVVESRNVDFPIGLQVYGWFGWQDYAVVGAEAILTRWERPVAPLSAYGGVLGLNGMTAWLGLSKLGRPVEGETVLVSTAAGAVGSAVGQLARAAGCRVIGLAGDDAKVARCLARFGYSAAANYNNDEVGNILAHLAPKGVDVFFDNVGGPMLDHALRTMNVGGRIIQCGTASVANWVPTPNGRRNEREILMRRLIWSGFVAFDHSAEFPQAMHALADLVIAGRLAYDEDISIGMEAAPGAIARLYAGENTGKSLIFIG